MPTLSPTVFARLTTDAGVSAIVAERVYPLYVREADKVFPYACFKTEAVSSHMASDGPTGLYSADLIVAAVDKTLIGSAALADAIQKSLDGATWSDTPNNIRIQGSFLKDDGREELPVTDQDTEAILYYQTELTFLCWFAAIS